LLAIIEADATRGIYRVSFVHAGTYSKRERGSVLFFVRAVLPITSTNTLIWNLMLAVEKIEFIEYKSN